MNNKDNQPASGFSTRREFIKKASTAAAAVAATNIFKTPVYGQNQAPSPGRVIGANDRIVMGYIGVGNQGMAHVHTQKADASANNLAQVAVCDVSKHRAGIAKDTIGGDVTIYDDHRKLLENKDIDAVTIATVDHWHADCAMDALNAGKHVYVEKPVTRYLADVFALEETVKRTGKKLQVGAQICSDARWHKAAELIKAGKIGQMVLAEDSYMRNNDKGEWNQYAIEDWCKPDDVNWERWQGKVQQKTDFNPDSYFRWRKYYRYCAGLLGDLVPHRLHPLMLATGNPEYPTRVVALGNKAFHTDANTPNTPERDSPEQLQLIAEFPSGLNILVASSSVNQVGLQKIIRGHKATLYVGDNSLELRPEKDFAEEIDPQTFEHLEPSGEKIPEHEKNLFNCIRNGGEPFAGINLAVRVQTVISLAEMSNRLNIMCLFDEKTRKITTGEGREIAALSFENAHLA